MTTQGAKAAAVEDVCVVRTPEFLRHEPPSAHPENPDRIAACLELFDERPAFARIPLVHLRTATDAELLAVHSAQMLASLQQQSGQTGWIDADTYSSEASFRTARLAAGATVEAAVAIWKGQYRRGMSLVRPPGHHASPRMPMGFCYFNNVACAAAAIRAEAPHARIAIVDFDLHHGNGTQDVFFHDPSVLFLSTHRRPFYPGTGGMEELGVGQGLGTTVNLPFGRAVDDGPFLAVHRSIVIPALDAFAPDMILVSAGYDGHIADPMEGLQVSTPGFRDLSRWLIECAERHGGKVLFCLEGGYDRTALKESVAASIDELLTVPRTLVAPPPRDDASEAVRRYRKFFGEYFPEIL